ncbi:hypothetical protein CCM_01402 [Cordyceps militaris CM01]|uniref:Uncharacterized protein n=1 Tax=Cordyceps militaris (strain CM01) TaxID=983644 RepID=G3J4Y1_CORMM|nr:uncharacterized protein CCM_01402 [Cordyceps militaris CM01]EGX96744.1 hypothetical protein CCM_01402 [Cordyceps militaris CM01]
MSSAEDPSHDDRIEADSNQEPEIEDEGAPNTVAARFMALLSGWPLGASAQPAEGPRPEVGVPQDILRGNGDEIKQVLKSIEELQLECNAYQRQVAGAEQYIACQERLHAGEVESLQDKIANYKQNNKTSTKIIKKLEARVAENEAQLSKAYSGAMSAWAEDVSRDMPDDVIKSKINSFFQGDFFSWCADMCAPEIEWNNAYKQVLYYYNLVNQDLLYLTGPAYLLFNYDAPDGSSSLVLLQAALAKTLVNTFLTNPYFLLGDVPVLQEIESALAQKSLKEATNWRVNTVRSLERTFPLDPEQIEVHVNLFLNTFGFLIETPDSSAREDLASLFAHFSQIALKLWQTPTSIRVVGMEHMDDCPFVKGNLYWECEPAVASALGEQVSGRPIGVVIRPCILSDPIPEPGEQSTPVVWSKALAKMTSWTDLPSGMYISSSFLSS